MSSWVSGEVSAVIEFATIEKNICYNYSMILLKYRKVFATSSPAKVSREVDFATRFPAKLDLLQ